MITGTRLIISAFRLTYNGQDRLRQGRDVFGPCTVDKTLRAQPVCTADFMSIWLWFSVIRLFACRQAIC